jgi:hypothetical protein
MLEQLETVLVHLRFIAAPLVSELRLLGSPGVAAMSNRKGGVAPKARVVLPVPTRDVHDQFTHAEDGSA